MRIAPIMLFGPVLFDLCTLFAADDFAKLYSLPCTERENMFSARGGSLPEAGRQPSAESSPSEAEKEQYELSCGRGSGGWQPAD